MNALRVALEILAIVLGPLVCRVTGHHRPHAWTHHAAPAFRICLRCSRPMP